MRQLRKFWALFVLLIGLVGLVAVYASHHSLPMVSPVGTIGTNERNLMVLALLLSAVVVLPVYALAIAIALKYRESNPKAGRYQPSLTGSRLFESVWWGIPCAIIFVLALVTWHSTYALDPYKPVSGTNPPLHIQVVALDWKWLFIYPGQNIAVAGRLTVPQDTPLRFDITSDSVMNSFWIPALGSQIYAMPGMNTQLNLNAQRVGSYSGSSANISGRGFSRMAFNVEVLPPAAFRAWVSGQQAKVNSLNDLSYKALAMPSVLQTPITYWPVQNGLYDSIIMKYMMPMDASGTLPAPMSGSSMDSNPPKQPQPTTNNQQMNQTMDNGMQMHGMAM